MQNADILRASMDDLVFEDRNKAYGAYFLRQIYKKHILRSLLIATTLFALFISLPMIVKALFKGDDEAARQLVDVNVDLMQPPPLDETQPPPPPPDLPPPLKTTLQFTEPEVVKDEMVKEELVEQEELKEADPGTKNEEGRDDGVDASLLDNTGKTLGEEQKIFLYVEQMPEFPGGVEKLYKFIGENLQYPRMAIDNDIQGKIIVTFVVDGNGKLNDIAIAEGSKKLGAGCEQAAIDVVKKLPNWKPGRQNGKAVSVRYNLPIIFKLNN